MYLNRIKHILITVFLLVSAFTYGQATQSCNIQAFEELNKLCDESQEVFDIITKGPDAEINIWMRFLSDDPAQGNLLAKFNKLNTDEKIEFIRRYSNLGDDELAKIDDFKALLHSASGSAGLLAKKLNKTELELFNKDFINAPAAFNKIANDEELLDAWKAFNKAKRTGLRKNSSALEAYVRLKKNPNLSRLGVKADDILDIPESVIDDLVKLKGYKGYS